MEELSNLAGVRDASGAGAVAGAAGVRWQMRGEMGRRAKEE